MIGSRCSDCRDFRREQSHKVGQGGTSHAGVQRLLRNIGRGMSVTEPNGYCSIMSEM